MKSFEMIEQEREDKIMGNKIMNAESVKHLPLACNYDFVLHDSVSRIR